MTKLKLTRLIKEKTMLYIFVIVPFILSITYYWLSQSINFNLHLISSFQDNIFELQLTFLGVLLTLLGLVVALPQSDFLKKLYRYGHYKIISRALLIGIISSLVSIVLFVIGIMGEIQTYLFIITISESLISTCWLYKVSKVINSG